MTGIRCTYVALHNKSSIICAPQHLAAKYRIFLTFWIIPTTPHCPPTALGDASPARAGRWAYFSIFRSSVKSGWNC
jgi:hypothetical protein